MDDLWTEVKIGNDQSYRWHKVENKFLKSKKYAEIEYYWYGEQWGRIALAMRKMSMRPTSMSFYKGAQIDEINKIIKIRGGFATDYVIDRHGFFWRSFLNLPEKQEVEYKNIGKIIMLPNIAGDNDSLKFFVNGDDLNSLLIEPTEENEAA